MVGVTSRLALAADSFSEGWMDTVTIMLKLSEVDLIERKD